MNSISVILAFSVILVPLFAFIARLEKNSDGWRFKGTGWQFIRFTVIAIALPLTALLALNDKLTEGAVAIIAGSMGYAFGKPNKPDKPKKSNSED